MVLMTPLGVASFGMLNLLFALEGSRYSKSISGQSFPVPNVVIVLENHKPTWPVISLCHVWTRFEKSRTYPRLPFQEGDNVSYVKQHSR